MYIFPFTVIDKVAAESRSGMADAPTVPYDSTPSRLRLSTLRRLLPSTSGALCEAEARDRGTKIAGAARAC